MQDQRRIRRVKQRSAEQTIEMQAIDQGQLASFAVGSAVGTVVGELTKRALFGE